MRYFCLNILIDPVSCTTSCSLVVLPLSILPRQATILTLFPQIFRCPSASSLVSPIPRKQMRFVALTGKHELTGSRFGQTVIFSFLSDMHNYLKGLQTTSLSRCFYWNIGKCVTLKIIGVKVQQNTVHGVYSSQIPVIQRSYQKCQGWKVGLREKTTNPHNGEGDVMHVAGKIFQNF